MQHTLQISPVHDKGITIRIDDDEEEVERKRKTEEEGEETEEEGEETEEEEEETELYLSSCRETCGFRPLKKQVPTPK